MVRPTPPVHNRPPASLPRVSPHFEAYYAAQPLLPPHEIPSFLDALARPLPLVLRISQRAFLSERAFSRLLSLLGEELNDQRALPWAGEGAWQLRLLQPPRERGENGEERRERGERGEGGGRGGGRRGGESYHRFLQRQQSRGSLVRQELASLVPALLLAPSARHAVLDMCAAPGSKSCQLLQMMEDDERRGAQGGGFVFANDAKLDRVISLNHRLQSSNVASPMCVALLRVNLLRPDQTPSSQDGCIIS